jgi:hypothetical protein
MQYAPKGSCHFLPATDPVRHLGPPDAVRDRVALTPARVMSIRLAGRSWPGSQNAQPLDLTQAAVHDRHVDEGVRFPKRLFMRPCDARFATWADAAP